MAVYDYPRLGIATVINASGKMTHLGGSVISPEVGQAMTLAGSSYVDLMEVKRRAGEVIAEWCGAEAAWVTSGAAAGVVLMTAACVAGNDPARVSSLPSATWEPRSILLQAGHSVNFGAPVEQMIRLGGGRPVAIGWANNCPAELLRASVDDRTAALMYVKSHHCVQKGMIDPRTMIEIAHAAGVPALVDAAAEEDLSTYVDLGADLVAYSGSKAFEGPTSGFVAGRQALIAACAAQEFGVARPMKVGKEAVMGLLTALESHQQADRTASREGKLELAKTLLGYISDLPHTVVSLQPDEAGRAISRVAVSPNAAVLGFDARRLMEELRRGTPSIAVRSHQVATGSILLDPRPLRPEDVPQVAAAIRAVYARHGHVAK